MKRDLDLIREILLGIEGNATFKVTPVPVLVLKFSIEERTFFFKQKTAYEI